MDKTGKSKGGRYKRGPGQAGVLLYAGSHGSKAQGGSDEVRHGHKGRRDSVGEIKDTRKKRDAE